MVNGTICSFWCIWKEHNDQMSNEEEKSESKAEGEDPC